MVGAGSTGPTRQLTPGYFIWVMDLTCKLITPRVLEESIEDRFLPVPKSNSHQQATSSEEKAQSTNNVNRGVFLHTPFVECNYKIFVNEIIWKRIHSMYTLLPFEDAFIAMSTLLHAKKMINWSERL